MIRALSLYGHVVSFLSCCISYDLGGRVGAALWHRGRSVEGFHRSMRRSGARFEDDWSSSTSSDLSGMCCSRSCTWAEHDSHSGLADRVGLSAGTEDSTCESWWKLGGLGRCGSLGTTFTEPEGYKCDRNYNTSFDTYQGEEAEDDTGIRSRRRYGVHSGAGIHEGHLDSESGGTYGWLPATRGRTHIGTAVSLVQEDSNAGHGTLCGLRGICAFWVKSSEGQQVQDVCAHSGWLCHKRTSRSSELHSMEGMLQGLHDGPFDAEHCRPSSTTCLRSLRGEVGEELPFSMAPHLRCRGSGEEWTSNKNEDDDQHGDQRRGDPTQRVGFNETVEHRAEEVARRIRILERTSAQPSTVVVGSWSSGSTKDSNRVVCNWTPEGRSSGSTTSSGRRQRKHGHPQEERQQGEERGKKEEAGIREGGARKISQTRSRRERRKRERRERKRRKGTRSEMLWMEQWKWALCFLSTWTGVRFESEESAPLHHLQLAGTPIKELRSEGHLERDLRSEAGLDDEEPLDPQGGVGGSKREGRGQRKAEGDEREKGGEERSRSGERGREDGERRDEYEEDPGLPVRPQEASSVEEYMEGRTFLFIHHFSGGERDVLAEQIMRQADIEDVKVKVVSVDREAGSGDLLKDLPYKSHLRWAQRGLVDGYHAGFPCSTFSRLRWRERQGYPGPVRSKLCPYGLTTNNSRQQAECDRGTVLAARAADMAKEVEAGKRPGEVIGPFSTLENPPESDHAQHLSAWELAEIKSYTDIMGIMNANFHTCAYQQKLPEGRRNLKPQRIAGSLIGIGTLAKFCSCLVEMGHVLITGKEASKASAVYPKDFCEEYAKLTIKHFQKVGMQEFPKLKMESKKAEVSDLQERRRKHKRKREGKEEGEEGEPPRNPIKLVEWKGGQGMHEMLKESGKKSDRPELLDFVGGMRDPAKVVERFPTMMNWGKDMNVIWTEFARDNPKVLEVAKKYGTDRCEFDIDLVMKWKKRLKEMMGIPEIPQHTTGSDEYRSPLDPDILEAWADLSGDPEKEVPNWVRHVAPLGITEKIGCCGIFPPNVDEEADHRQGALMPEELQDVESQLAMGDILNYKSVEEDKAEAKVELDRYHHAGYTRYYTENEVKERFSSGTISKLGLIIKVKESGVKKRRVILDLRRSGGNAKATLPEKLILPRPKDAVDMLRNIYKREGGKGDMELVVIDISDAFMALPVHRNEHQHTLAPALEQGQFIAFVALLFGYKVAPLLWSRVAALMARLLQAAIPRHQGQHQCYLDDSIWTLRGDLEVRNHNLAFILYSMASVGLKVALSKGERANTVQWIGIKLSVFEKDILLTLPEAFVKELVALLESWNGKGMIPLKELRKAAGKLSWLAGVLPRARWVVPILYGSMKQQEIDVKQGTEEERRQRRQDPRPKDGLIAVKRVEQARVWVLAYLKTAMVRPVRKLKLDTAGLPSATIVTDASPEGLGGLLLINNRIVAIYATRVSREDCDRLGLEFGQASSQGALEAYAILQGVALWRSKLIGCCVTLTVESDSVVALALTQKLSGKSPALNYIGAELSILAEDAGIEEFRNRHIPGAANVNADYLSRPSKWKDSVRPAELKGMDLTKVEKRYGKLEPPRDNPSLWSSGVAAKDAWHSIRA